MTLFGYTLAGWSGPRLLAVGGQWQRSSEGVMHLIARELHDVTPWLGRLGTSSRDFH